jgi:hypothetical protein
MLLERAAIAASSRSYQPLLPTAPTRRPNYKLQAAIEVGAGDHGPGDPR